MPLQGPGWWQKHLSQSLLSLPPFRLVSSVLKLPGIEPFGVPLRLGVRTSWTELSLCLYLFAFYNSFLIHFPTYLNSFLVHLLEVSIRVACYCFFKFTLQPMFKSLHPYLINGHINSSEVTKLIELSHILHHTHSLFLLKPKKLLLLGPLHIFRIIFSIYKVQLTLRFALPNGFNYFPIINRFKKKQVFTGHTPRYPSTFISLNRMLQHVWGWGRWRWHQGGQRSQSINALQYHKSKR